MNPKNNFYKSNKIVTSNLGKIFFTLFLIFVVSCKPTVGPFKIIAFNGVSGIYNYSKTIIGFAADSINPGFLLCSKGDLLRIESDDNFFFIPDWDAANHSYNIHYDDNILFVNDKIKSICISDSNQLIPWFENLIKKDLSELQFICFESDVPEICFPYLVNIAKIKPDVGFYKDGTLREMAGFINNFNPRYLILSDFKDDDINLMTNFTNLEMLFLDNTIISEPLPELSQLKQVFLILNEQKDIPVNLFINNSWIEKLNLQFKDNFEMSLLSPLDNLKELVISYSDSISPYNFNGINRLNKLEALSIVGNKKLYDPAQIELPGMRWMAFDSHFTQEEFDSFIITHQKLEVVELVKNDEITNLKILSTLPNLFGLSITDTITDLASVKALRNLKYLSLPLDFLDDSTNMEDIQKAIPGSRINKNNGYLYLGSG